MVLKTATKNVLATPIPVSLKYKRIDPCGGDVKVCSRKKRKAEPAIASQWGWLWFVPHLGNVADVLDLAPASFDFLVDAIRLLAQRLDPKAVRQTQARVPARDREPHLATKFLSNESVAWTSDERRRHRSAVTLGSLSRPKLWNNNDKLLCFEDDRLEEQYDECGRFQALTHAAHRVPAPLPRISETVERLCERSAKRPASPLKP